MENELIKTLASAIDAQAKKAKSTAYDTTAEVRRVEGDTVWVHIPGGVDETPVKKTIACSTGDTVQVRIANGRGFLVGNGTAPPTDDTTAIISKTIATEAKYTADTALEDAVRAKTAADSAVDSAATAGRAASVAQAAAEAAQATADTKRRVFTSQPVPPYSVGDLWVDAGAVQNGDNLEYGSDAYSNLVGTGQVGYMIVGGAPQESVVYVCTFARTSSESFSSNDWQLAATDDGAVDELREWFWHDANGAHVLGDATGFRNDITSTGMNIVDTSTETSVAEFGASGATIGTSGDAQTIITQNGFSIIGKDNIESAGITFKETPVGNTILEEAFNADVPYQEWCSFEVSKTPVAGTKFILGFSTRDRGIIDGWMTLTAGTAADNTSPTAHFAYHYDGNKSISIKRQKDQQYNYILINIKYTTQNTVYGGAFSLGARASETVGVFSATFGEGLIAESTAQVVTGKYNSNSSSDLFEVGNGSSDSSRSNAFSVASNGNITAGGEVTDGFGNVLSGKVDSSSLADTVTEEGTSGDWTYRKWSSGLAEAWGTLTASSATFTTTGSVYYRSLTSQSFPTGLFNAAPMVTATCEMSNVGGTTVQSVTSSTFTVNVLSAVSTARALTVYVHAVGTWQ